MSRIFDHLTGEPEDKLFSRVAHQMKRDPRWSTVPERDEPQPVHGTIPSARQRLAIADRIRRETG